ncbi:Heart- and neural crest derivatives-expressed protein [Schistosoma japonicum]|uniref:Heart-and neural crest derivatives-expressed protein n=1 Tax=Schistosoma japonicum TaxID=6182 RepID=A0A4Z2DDZ2_SCHJA|nr:Heart- and neural crest derivatives-expressed protein [Schistosoma japonicum]
MTTEEDIPYHWKSSLNQSYLESVIEKHTFTTNYTDITNKNDYNTMLEALSNVNQYSLMQHQCFPLTQNDYSALKSPIQSNTYTLMNGVNHSMSCCSTEYDAYHNDITSTTSNATTTTINNNNNGHTNRSYHANTSTPRFTHESVWREGNNEYIPHNSSYDPITSPLSLTVPCSSNHQIDCQHSPNKLTQSTNTNSSHQINTRIGSIHNLHENFTFLQNNLKNSRFRSSIKLCATIRKEHQREQDKNRTRTLNVAFCRLRSCLPEIPKDTKLTKIRTLRYAITYIKQLIELIHQTDPVSSSILMLDTGSNSLKVESEHDQSLMKDSGYLSFMDR